MIVDHWIQSTKEMGHMCMVKVPPRYSGSYMSYMSTFVSSQSRVAHSPSMQGMTDTTEIQTSGLQTPSLYLVGQAVQHLVTATSMCVSTWGNTWSRLVSERKL